MEAEQFTIRFAAPDDDPAIAALVVEGFLDKFRPVFGGRMDRSLKVMEKWVSLEHASGGVTSFVVEDYSTAELAASVGVRTAPSRDDVLARGLWRALTRNLGLARAVWATTLLSYPRYSHTSSQASAERTAAPPAHRAPAGRRPHSPARATPTPLPKPTSSASWSPPPSGGRAWPDDSWRRPRT